VSHDTPTAQFTRTLPTAADTERLGRALAQACRKYASTVTGHGLQVNLRGDLGAGKTALVRGLAAGLGVAPGEVQSPTFTLLREHRGAHGRLLHFDLYRLSPDEVAACGFEERLLGPGVKAVEWPERLPFDVPGAWTLTIVREGGERRLDLAEAPGGGAG